MQGYNESRLKSSFRKFLSRYNDLVCDYKLSLAHMLNDFFLVDNIYVVFGDQVFQQIRWHYYGH
jgi:hypothetical protein